MKLLNHKLALFSAVTLMLLSSSSCDNGYIPSHQDTVAKFTKGFDIPFVEEENGVMSIKIFINGTTGTKALFDTGCSGLSLSGQELKHLDKHNSISWEDLRGDSKSTIADGSEVYDLNFSVQLSVTDTKGEDHSVQTNASVMIDLVASAVAGYYVPIDNCTALVGNAVLNEFAEHSYTVDLENHVIHFE